MRIGIGLPNAVPGRSPREVGRWAQESERLGFHSLGTIDRLLYDVLDPLVTLGVAAAVTERVELLPTVLNAGWRRNAVLFAKQLATVDLVSGGRLTAGLGIGGWPDDFAASGAPATGHGRILDDTLATLRAVWDGEVTGAAGPAPLPGTDRPGLLIGGTVPRSFARAARSGDGWVAPLMGDALLTAGVGHVRAAWRAAGRTDRPRVVTGRYFSCGPDAEAVASRYIAHYYGPEEKSPYYAPVRADVLDSDAKLSASLAALAGAGADDVVLYPCSAAPVQVGLLAGALERAGARHEPAFTFRAASA
ncbi:LLM class flavin-dependent oxidoreductase [Streptomyces sp. NBC_01803]|uniref:LLM class flavin-dependent oxidoreductase n=1 Tax=Streptomyces sp. NBC_01803 TaxID=2975946 RepID=UPI002DD9D6CF|nr:LLM class flavin-dependent oxidoreductase [Streptomyces sp. NBC_01803]WSA45693.1 LLM class flavin-dependent oxidoreductase [Streptomyces sp. NBC_01803]